MKILFTFLSLILPGILFAQAKPYELRLELKHLRKPDTAYLYKSYGWTDQSVLDSAFSENGLFIFRGETNEPTQVTVAIGKDTKTLYLHPGKIWLKGNDSLKYSRVTGSEINKEYENYLKFIAPALNYLTQIEKEFRSAPTERQRDTSFVSELMRKAKKGTAWKDSLNTVYYTSHPISFLTKEAHKPKITAKDVGPAIGSIAPDFVQNDVNDIPVKLSNFRGQYVLLDFWASWCGPCRAENPNLLKAYERFKDRNFTILGISLDQPGKKDAWLEAIEKDGLKWQQVSDLQFWNNAVAKQYGIRSIPINFLISPEGIVVAKNLRGENLAVTLERLISAKNK